MSNIVNNGGDDSHQPSSSVIEQSFTKVQRSFLLPVPVTEMSFDQQSDDFFFLMVHYSRQLLKLVEQ